MFFMLAAAPGRAAEPTLLRVNAFPNAKALPLHAGIANGIFEQRGLKVELTLTRNSRSQRDGLPPARSTSCIPRSTTRSP